jgi:hypothetical protein
MLLETIVTGHKKPIRLLSLSIASDYRDLNNQVEVEACSRLLFLSGLLR